MPFDIKTILDLHVIHSGVPVKGDIHEAWDVKSAASP